nr:DUF1576 domain-containing protein [uncultured Cellulosilyticum sp.]
MSDKIVNELEQQQLKRFFIITIIFFIGLAFCVNSPIEIFEGMKQIIISRDALITDYFELTNYGAAFFNGALMMIAVAVIMCKLNVPITGLTLAVFFINAGFGLFGKNPINVIPILIGTMLYARMQGVSVRRYVYTGLFGTCLAPLVTEIVYLLPFSTAVNMVFAILIGILIGFILPSLSMHTASMHMGYSLFNVGFSAGILGFAIVSILKAFGLESESVFIWKEGRPVWLVLVLYGYFISTFCYGAWINKGQIKSMLKIHRHPGRAVADFILMDGIGNTLMNMAAVGSVGLTYILLIGGDLSGPVVGGILTVFGFGAFGVHMKNFIPCMLGVYIAAQIKIFTPAMPSIQLAALFSSSLAPIAGQFGLVAGIIAGILHTSIVTSTTQMYLGLNLYNNGFAAGFVAIIMIPLLESFMKKFTSGDIRR